MTAEKKHYARYIFNRGLQTLWKGEAADEGSLFRSVALTSDDFNSTQAVFQVYALEGVGNGIKDGRFAGTKGGTKVLFDNDFTNLEGAAKKFGELVAKALSEGFRRFDFMEMMEYEQKRFLSQKR